MSAREIKTLIADSVSRVQRGSELPVGHLDVLDDAEDVGELQPQELHAGRLGLGKDLPLPGFECRVLHLLAQSDLPDASLGSADG